MDIKQLKQMPRGYWINFFVPYGIIWGFKYLKRKLKRNAVYLRFFEQKKYQVIIKNEVFKNIHTGERCFVLGTGYSIGDIDISLLKNENKIFLSQFYLNKDYHKINPKYHVFNALGGHYNYYKDHKIFLNLYRQIDEFLPSTVNMFFWYAHDYEFIKKNNLFKGKPVYYIDYHDDLRYMLKYGIDATKHFFNPEGCAMAGIQLALFMGFREIYLHGIDLNYEDYQSKNDHFYDGSLSCLYHCSPEVRSNDLKNSVSMMGCKTFAELCALCRIKIKIYEDHLVFKKFCDMHGIKIYNTSSRSLLLDVYEYRRFEDVVSPIINMGQAKDNKNKDNKNFGIKLGL